MFIPPRLRPGDLIGIPSPSAILDPERDARYCTVLQRMGFRIRMGESVYRDGYGYAATAEERAADINAMVRDPDVRMLLFSGGDAAAEVLPLLDYSAIRENPKIFCSYSDGTAVTNAVYAKTGLVTYYGQNPGAFRDLTVYSWQHFVSAFMDEPAPREFPHDREWVMLRGGRAEGTLIGGYTSMFLGMLDTPYIRRDPDTRYLLFLETHEHFDPVGQAATWYAMIEQSRFMDSVSGLIVGSYSESVPPEYLAMLARIGERRGIPVVYCDDFGHGNSKGILPIGMKGTMEAGEKRLWIG
jgi:muramoyltetrapeptide carboxypeptidase